MPKRPGRKPGLKYDKYGELVEDINGDISDDQPVAESEEEETEASEDGEG